ncbi:hypothetical protein, partial [Endozoicomonas sp. SESOKO1]|uniref:hypothetical protein n=1 Tax=Endozoicomonas sp. SESOKO1 TaxID=2828742 RepID=UPI0021496DA9
TAEDSGELDGVAELFAEPETQQVSGLTSALATEEAIPSLTSVAAGIEDSEQLESAMYRSDDSGNSQDSIPEETALTADRPDTPDSSVSSDSDYFSEDEDDQITTQALRSETDFSSDVAKESAPVEMAQTVRQSTANIREIAKRRMQEKQQSADSAPVSKTPSPATSSNHNSAINRNRDDANRNRDDAQSSGLDRSRADQATAGTTRSSTATRTAPDIINKPVDVSGVKSVVAARINAARKAKSTDAIPKQERAIDKKKLGVSSTYNEANVIENAYDRLQNNADNLKGSQDIARTARKYIASEAQDSGPFLPGPTPKESKALRALGLGKNASERDIRLALLNKASESAESNSRAEHVKTMRALTTLHNALFK